MSTRALVTGGAGFIGSHVVDALIRESYQVVVVDDLSSGEPDRVAAEADLEQLDITDAAGMQRVVDAVAPHAIFHLAAQSSVTVSVDNPARDCAVNVAGTLNVLEAAGRHRSPVVFTSTGGALYGDDAPLPTPEDCIPAPLAPYGASKWAAEAYVRTWARASGIPHTVCRLGNVYGPRQSPHGEAGVVAIFSYRLWRGDRPTLYGSGEPTRDYVHVADVASALLRSSGVGGVFNVATGIETTTREVLARLQSAAGTQLEPELAPLRIGELRRSAMDPARAARALGWRPEVTIDTGLANTFAALVAAWTASDGPLVEQAGR